MCAARFFQLAGHIICKHVFKISGNIPEPYASPVLQCQANKARALQQRRRRWVLKSWCSIAPAMGVEPNVYDRAPLQRIQSYTHKHAHIANVFRMMSGMCDVDAKLNFSLRIFCARFRLSAASVWDCGEYLSLEKSVCQLRKAPQQMSTFQTQTFLGNKPKVLILILASVLGAQLVSGWRKRT